MIGGWELLLLFLIVLIVFGAKRVPEIAKSLGKSVNEFKKAKDEILEDVGVKETTKTKSIVPIKEEQEKSE